MVKAKVSKPAVAETPETQDGVDGRMLRGERSRQQIVDALFKLIRAGEMNPGAAQVAEAGCHVSMHVVAESWANRKQAGRAVADRV